MRAIQLYELPQAARALPDKPSHSARATAWRTHTRLLAAAMKPSPRTGRAGQVARVLGEDHPLTSTRTGVGRRDEAIALFSRDRLYNLWGDNHLIITK